MTDKMIRRFSFDDIIIDDDSRLVQTRETYRIEMNSYMRDSGYIPLADISPVWRSEYVDGKYRCSYIHQGIYVGDKAWKLDCVMDNKVIPKNKSERSSQI